MKYLIIVQILFSAVSFALMRGDKYLAKQDKERISEKTLMLFGILGPVGMIAAMSFKFSFGRHKNRKKYFWLAGILGIILWATIFTAFWAIGK